MSLFSQGYRETNQNQEVSDKEHSPIPGPLNTPDQTSYQPTPEIAPFDNRPPFPLNNNLDHLSPLIPPPDISRPSSTSSPPPTTNSSSSMSNLPPPSFAAATAGTQYRGQAAAGPSNLFNPPQQQPAAPFIRKTAL